MADIKFSQLGAAAALTGVEIIPLVQGGVNVRATVSALGTFLGSGYVSKTGDENIGGVKTFTNISNWNLSANARIIYGEPGGDSAGISLFRGDWNGNAARRGDIRVRTGDMLLGVGAAADNSAPVNWVSIGPTYMRPTIPGIWSLGTVGNAWLNTFTAELTLTGDDAAKARSRTSLKAATVADGAWTAPALQNGFANLGAPFDVAGYRLVDNRVELRGVIVSGSHPNSPLLFTLPAGFRPATRKVMFSGCSVPGQPFALARIDVDSDGKVTMLQPLSTSTDFIVLDNLSFYL